MRNEPSRLRLIVSLPFVALLFLARLAWSYLKAMFGRE